jgi:hypothetical protein
MACSLWIATVVFYLFSMTSVVVGAESSTSHEERASQWERAAVNYEWAAMAQQDAAQTLLSEAKLLREASYDTSKEQRKNMLHAAAKESRSADLELAAGSGYDHAADNWLKVGGRNSRSKESSDVCSAEMAGFARQKATVAYYKAAELYEMAAQAYFNSGESLRQASLSQKAARVREKLAMRR